MLVSLQPWSSVQQHQYTIISSRSRGKGRGLYLTDREKGKDANTYMCLRPRIARATPRAARVHALRAVANTYMCCPIVLWRALPLPCCREGPLTCCTPAVLMMLLLH